MVTEPRRPKSIVSSQSRESRMDGSIVEAMGITGPEIAARKEWLQFDDADVDRLKDLNVIAREYSDDVIDSLYEHFMANPTTAERFRDPAVLARVKSLQKAYFFKLTQGDYGREYVEERLRIGAVHGRIGLDPKWYLGAYSLYIRLSGEAIFNAYKHQPQKFLDAHFSMLKLIFLDIGLAIDTYIYNRESTIRDQEEAIKELSTPVLQLREGLLILPIVGVIDSNRARQLTDSLLQTIRSNRGRVVVMDITGVGAVDSKVANHLLQTVDSARLMGAKVIVTGLSPEVAQTITQVGVDLSRITTAGDLQGGIEVAEKILGYKTVKTGRPVGAEIAHPLDKADGAP